MKRLTVLLAILIMLLFTVPALAQDDSTAVPTEDVPAATLEAAPTEEAVATQEIVVIVTITPAESPTPTLTPTPEMTAVAGTGGDDGGTGETSESSPFANLGWVLFLFTASALAFVLVTWMRELRKSAAAGDQNSKNLLAFVTATQSMLPVDAFVALIDNLDKRAKATNVPGEIDDKIAAQIRAAVYEALGRELPPELPVTPPAGSPQG